MNILAFIGAFVLMALAFGTAVSAGASRDMDGISPVTPFGAFLVAAIFLVLQAILWISFGMHWGA
ncbi:hypothetical protein [Paracoccus denitrificans]|uniref:hypothetical protein n=1 Tax=Paracoccus denitrificans TaxID=266 RepID=UPI00336525AE